MKPALQRLYSTRQLTDRVARMGRSVSRDYGDRTVDVVILLDSAFIFAADLIRNLSCPVVCHFLQADFQDVQFGGFERREINFGRPPRLENRDVLVVDAVLQSGLTQDFLIKRLQESKPRSLKLAVLFDKPGERRVNLKPDYFAFEAASKYLAGYGLAGSRGWYRNLPYVGIQPARARVASAPRRSAAVRRVR